MRLGRCHHVSKADALSLKDVKAGILQLYVDPSTGAGSHCSFIQHTSAGVRRCASRTPACSRLQLSINENYDSDVRRDMDMALDTMVPESLPWRHTDE